MPADFIHRWRNSEGAELANAQSFLKELCTLLDVPHPEPTVADESHNRYVFEKAVDFNNGDGTTSPGRIDLYRQGCFVLESKQGVERKAAEQAEMLATKTKQKKFRTGTAVRGTPMWEQAMAKARQQARRYAEALPVTEDQLELLIEAAEAEWNDVEPAVDDMANAVTCGDG